MNATTRSNTPKNHDTLQVRQEEQRRHPIVSPFSKREHCPSREWSRYFLGYRSRLNRRVQVIRLISYFSAAYKNDNNIESLTLVAAFAVRLGQATNRTTATLGQPGDTMGLIAKSMRKTSDRVNDGRNLAPLTGCWSTAHAPIGLPPGARFHHCYWSPR